MANLIKEKWKKRFASFPIELQQKITEYDASDKYLTLDKLKGTRKYPEIGDIFELQVLGRRKFYGVVINNHINNINGDDLILVCIFKEGIDVKTILNNVIREEDLFFAPEIVGKEYWTRGLFHNIDRYTGKISIEDYCFYSIGKDKIYDEYGNEIALKKIICTYGVATIFGIGILVGQELLIEGEQL